MYTPELPHETGKHSKTLAMIKKRTQGSNTKNGSQRKTLFPSWLESAIFYQIYPQSFQDSNDDGIGDIQGIIDRLGYIEDLGCNAIWLSPLFESPFRDAGYDITNFYKIAPRYGTENDLCRLFVEAKKRGTRSNSLMRLP